MTGSAKGIALGSAAAFLWGSTYVAIRLIYALSDLDPIGVAFARFLIGSAALVGIMAAHREARRLAILATDPIPFLWLGLTGIAAVGILGAIGSALTTAVNVSLIMNANPIFVALLGPLVGERLTASRLGGALVGLGGLSLVVLGSAAAGPSFASSRDLWGCLAAVGAAFAWATYTVFGKGVVRRYGGFLTTTVAMLWGTLLLTVVLGAAHQPRHLPVEAILLLVYLGLVPSALAFALWYRALALVDATVLAPTQYLAPVGTVALARVLLDERVGTSFVAGLVLIFVGIALASQTPRGERHVGPDG